MNAFTIDDGSRWAVASGNNDEVRWRTDLYAPRRASWIAWTTQIGIEGASEVNCFVPSESEAFTCSTILRRSDIRPGIYWTVGASLEKATGTDESSNDRQR
ncbi:hypothetical protein GCM10020255_014270 [Rhodococcus baikonurensis]